jgi:hypothetical protein
MEVQAKTISPTLRRAPWNRVCVSAKSLILLANGSEYHLNIARIRARSGDIWGHYAGNNCSDRRCRAKWCLGADRA